MFASITGVDRQLYHDSATTERFKSIWDGIALFAAHPIFGAGLGAHMEGALRSDGIALVIHSTPVWLLAEMGVVGFLAFTVPLLRVFRHAWGEVTPDVASRLLVLIIVAFAIMAIVHEMLYQRTFWLLFGTALAVARPSGRGHESKPTSDE